MRGKKKSDELRAAVMGALLTGMSVKEVAKTYKLDPKLVYRWKNQIDHEKLRQVANEKNFDFCSLLLECAEAGLKSFKTICDFASSEAAWINRQPASELAVFAGVTFDKSLRILEAAETEPKDEDTAGKLEA